ncbi:probable steroid-binding protein 3 [Glycine soja]|uniref:probable steroid-binding protein 3 n=1 Tax=Glycine max TaxID=3847 RepID=UPI0002337073|nr:probable steroid-binding protein 3 [Glycine max]XP_028187237.1 probable steroid-binding protein 3 [Glycine soja]|eukprot:XP_003520273.1 probable steroid-binding protein 3 [Glycine max]
MSLSDIFVNSVPSCRRLSRRGCQLCRESEKQRVTRKVKWFNDQKGVGRVYDVSTGKSFYGPSGPYAMFAVKDASRALAKMSKNDDDISPSLDDLSDKEIGVLNDWENKFQAKYPVVARVLN